MCKGKIMDIYSIEFDPNKLSHQQEELGLEFADLDTAVELMKKEEKMIIAELTLQFSVNKSYKNMKELDGLLYTHDKFKDYTDRYSETLKKRNRAKIRFESFRAFRDDLRTKVVNEREMAKHNL
tara:strand:- start:630 stop:1001 length:372 start_codon:yes stop_codon:yes gene_type:complete